MTPYDVIIFKKECLTRWADIEGVSILLLFDFSDNKTYVLSSIVFES